MNLNLIEDNSLYVECQYDDLSFVHVRSLPYQGTAGVKRILSEIQFHYNLVKVMKKKPKADLDSGNNGWSYFKSGSQFCS